MRISIILFFLMCSLLSVNLFSQSTPLSANSLLLAAPKVSPVFKTPLLYLYTSDDKLEYKSTPDLESFMLNNKPSDLPATYCAADLAFFCRLEVQMEKATKIPVRFRLGDVQYVDYLEGKHERWRYNH